MMKPVYPALGALLLALPCNPALAQHSPIPAAAPAQVKVDIGAQRLDRALNAWASQTGFSIMVSMEGGAQKRMAPKVAGLYTPEEALKRLLAHSDLRYEFVDARTVAIREPQPSVPAPSSGEVLADPGMRLVRSDDKRSQNEWQEAASAQREAEKDQAQPAEPAASGEPVQITVTGSRIRTGLEEPTAQPVLTITRQEIDRTGVSSLGELLGYIPQVSSFTRGQQVIEAIESSATAGLNSTRVTATLRGAPAGGTLLLINGRRAPKNGQEGGNDAYDLSGIPLAAVERVDVLLDGASSIYGADAVGGVINVILKKNYRGTEVRLGHENTFEQDAGVSTASITHGISAGRFSGLLTLSWEKANAMMWRDRSFLASADRRPWGGSDNRGTFPGGAGSIAATDEVFPGTDVSVLAIPSGASGLNLTVQDYLNAGPLAPVVDPAEYSLYATPYRRKSVTGGFEYDFRPWLTAFTELRWGESRTWSQSTPIAAINAVIPAGAPGNPFSEAIRLNKYFWDLPTPVRVATGENAMAGAGIRGALPRQWNYEAATSYVPTRPSVVSAVTNTLNQALLNAAFSSARPPVLFYDSTHGVSPNAPGVIEALTAVTATAERNETWIHDIKADGPLWMLPAGAMRVAVGAEYRVENVGFPTRTVPTARGASAKDRTTSGLFAEARVPLVSEQQAWPLVNRVDVSLSARHDRYSDFPGATSLQYGLLYKPFRWLMLRATQGEGYKVPTLRQLYEPAYQALSLASGVANLDPLRGNTALPFLLPTTAGGNPALKPERSESLTAGAVLEVPALPGLSLSFDYYQTDYVDRVGNLTRTERILYAPHTITRGANLSTDPAGWPGPVIGLINIPVNIAVNRIGGYDLGARYYRSTRFGDVAAAANASRTTRNESLPVPDAPPNPLVSRASLPLQATGSVFLTRGAFEAGVLSAYRAGSRPTATLPVVIPSALRWDLRVSYDTGAGSRMGWAGDAWYTRLIADTALSLTIFNVLNTEPPIASYVGMPDNTVLDSRLRRYALNLTRRF